MENSVNIGQLRASPLRIKFETCVGFATSFIGDRAQTSVLLTNGHDAKRTLPWFFRAFLREGLVD
jgi:hypothetical protein